MRSTEIDGVWWTQKSCTTGVDEVKMVRWNEYWMERTHIQIEYLQ